ncbi:MAG: hypothetical protein HYV52_02095 [Parcubacteria group bacterium]|nr:hypothetical protein [Parcubacteria group bacterium]
MLEESIGSYNRYRLQNDDATGYPSDDKTELDPDADIDEKKTPEETEENFEEEEEEEGY